ncbi:unnamed protein product [Didymodactylos carnosus]|uniref:Uncharacterized protein n=1 Tax=Didymodactylos carnosus TaxID=1234261 RepID=A0A814IXW0_9BILA|nr:unnamed protein product [Didymodactylos carnosus]CAF1030574.1 unnamed protein product [Didymodactylos carnosus]CAF3616658.1 unnamed protein product [Didymodactylos carnosus]CAF3801462.1 unnamed protein product [Didymodactylos carnosus]
MESRIALSTVGEDEEKSGVDFHPSPSVGDDSFLNELEELAPSTKADANKFQMLCDGLQTCFSEIDNSMMELLELKDNLLLQFLPPNVSARITLVISRLYRAYSLAQIPVHEVIRLVQLYSQPWDQKSAALKKLYETNETKKRILNIAIQRLTSVENQIIHNEQKRCIDNWEKMYIKLALPRCNVRNWKFRLKTFRETSQLGYEHVISWLNSEVRPQSTDYPNEDVLERDEEFGGETTTVPIPQDGEEFGDDPESEAGGSFLSSGKQRARVHSTVDSTTNRRENAAPIITKAEVEIQVSPEHDDQQTWTGDLLSSKYLLFRIYRPTGILKTKFQCIAHAHSNDYKTIPFLLENKSLTTTGKEDESNTKRTRFAGGGRIKPTDAKIKKRTDSTSPEDELNIIDKSQCDELLIPMPSVFKRRSVFQTDNDNDAVRVDVMGDDKLIGSMTLTTEDLLMLDLPNLRQTLEIPLTIIDDSSQQQKRSSVAQTTTNLSTKNLYLDSTSTDLYQSIVSRTPQTYPIYNDKRETIGKLPLLLFWYNKIEINQAAKSTMTAPLEIRAPTPKTIYLTELKPDTREQSLSPVVTTPNPSLLSMPPVKMISHATEPSESRLEQPALTDDDMEIVKSHYEQEISKLHENYQSEIRRLSKLLNDMQLRTKDQMANLSESDENVRELLSMNNDQKLEVQEKRKWKQKRPDANTAPAIVYGKDLPKDFLERYQMFLERSLTRRHQLMAKIEQENARTTERQLEIQHRLSRPEQEEERYDDLCLPAVFMPFRSGNVYNPRAYRFFHHIGSTDPRLTQTPSIFKLPPLPAGSVCTFFISPTKN